MEQCPEKADFRYTWPGNDESLICEEHARKMKAVASAMGYCCQILPYEGGERCDQRIGAKP